MKHVKWLSVAAFILTIPAANWLIQHVGTCMPDGPCLISVWPGVMAPSGVLMVGVALVLRDWIHERAGAPIVMLAIVAGAVASLALAPAALAIASGAAFLLSELADMAVYSPLRRRSLPAAVALSSLIGAAVDSAAFLLIAFGSLNYLPGQVLGKLWAAAFALSAIYAHRALRGAA